MSTEIDVVPNEKVDEAKARATARGATDIKVEKLNGKSRLTITYPELPESDDN